MHVLRQRNHVDVMGLLTTFNQEVDRVAMHAVRRQLVEAQARAAGLPLITIPMPPDCTNEHYDAAMVRAVANARAAGFTSGASRLN